MRTWMKYLVIGWSIVSVGIVTLSFQLMKTDFIKEDYDVMTIYRVPEKVTDSKSEIEVIGEILFKTQGANSPWDDYTSITKKEFVERMKKAKGVTIESKTKVDKAIYIILPIYAFFVWCTPILVFSLVGIIFGREKKNSRNVNPM